MRDGFSRKVSFIRLPSFGAVPAELCPPRHFALFVAGDARSVSTGSLTAFAESLVRAGCAFAACWGPGSEHTEEAFDYADIEVNGDTDANTENNVLLTTSHRDESL